MAAATVRAYEAEGMLVFEDTGRAVRALAALHAIEQGFRRQPESLESLDLAPPTLEPIAAGSEVEAKRVLAAAGIPVLVEALATSADEAVAAAELVGGAVAMKIVSPDILHKTEVGGVQLGVRGEAAVREAHASLIANARIHAPGARIEGVLVAPMAAAGVETIIGVSRDATFGPVVMFGSGGVLAEALQDVAFGVAPFGPEQAGAMVRRTRVAATLLRGFRGSPPADEAALVCTLVAVSRLAVISQNSIESLDINPLLVLPAGQGVVALDAALVPRA